MSRTHAKMFVLHKLLADGGSAFVHLDSRRGDVWVPRECRGRPQLILQLGLNLVVPVRDFKMSPQGWSATLSFGRQPLHCSVPWDAVYLIVNENGMGAVWLEDAPPEADVPGRQQPTYAELVEAGQAITPYAALDDALEREEAAKVAASSKKAAPIEERRKTLPPNWRVIEGGKSDEPARIHPSGPKAG